MSQYELRSGTGRRGPHELWTRFDAAVQQRNQAGASDNLADVVGAYAAVAHAALLVDRSDRLHASNATCTQLGQTAGAASGRRQECRKQAKAASRPRMAQLLQVPSRMEPDSTGGTAGFQDAGA
jgi:hypothetical protein